MDPSSRTRTCEALTVWLSNFVWGHDAVTVLHRKHCDCGNERVETLTLLSLTITSTSLLLADLPVILFSFMVCLLPNFLNGDDQVDENWHRPSLKNYVALLGSWQQVLHPGNLIEPSLHTLRATHQ